MKIRLCIVALLLFSFIRVYATDYYVNATTGSNTTGDGTSGNPWQTITYALSKISSSGHTIYIAAGTYNTLLGETFPIFVENGVSLSGEGALTTIIDADKTNRVVTCIGITDPLTFIEGFRITGGQPGGSDSYGGGIYISAGSVLTIRNNTIDDNYSSDGGGAIYITNSSPDIYNNTISNNIASSRDGSAIYLYNSSSEIKRNTIINHSANYPLSCVYISGSSSAPRLINNLIAKNSSDAIFCENGSPTILNNTISDNTGNGIYNTTATPDSIINNIISFNSEYGIYEGHPSYDPGKVWYNLFYMNTSGLYYDEGTTGYYTASTLSSGVTECKNNLDGDPAYNDRSGGDYHLQEGSPAIDAGDSNSPLDPDGSRADIGAYYFIMPPPDAPVANAPSFIGQADVILSWNSTSTATGYFIDLATDAGFTSYVSEFENLDVSDVINYSVAYGLTGNTTYYFRVRAYNESGTGPNSNEILFITMASLPPAPGIPVVNEATDIVQTSFLTHWESTPDATSYRIDVSTDISFSSFATGYNDHEILNATELTVTGLTDNTQYYYRLKACNSGGCSSYSDAIPITTLPNPPPAPWSTSPADITQTSFTANWDSSPTATGYILDVATKTDFTSFVPGYNNLNVYNVTNYSVTGLSANSYYYYRIKAYNSGGIGPYSAFIQAVTLPNPPDPPTLNDPTKVTQTGLTLNWNYSPGATGYYVDLALNDAFTSFVSGYENLDVTNVTSYNVSDLTSSTEYFYRIRAYNSGGPSDYSEARSIVTLQNPPPAPVALEASDTTQAGFTANWEHAILANGYYIFWTTDAAFVTYDSLQLTYSTSYNLTGLDLNTTYYYIIKAYNNGGFSEPSNVITVTTLQIPAPAAPVATDPSYIGQTDFVATWGSSETAAGYYLDIATDAAFASFVTDFNDRDVGNVLFYGVSGLAANTTYYYRVRAYNAGGTGDNSNTITVTTLLNPPDPPPAPVAYGASNISQTGFTANWSSLPDATGYRIDVSTDNSFNSFVTGYEDANVTNATSLDISGMTAGTNYFYRVRAYNSGGTSGNSGTTGLGTLPWPPPASEAFDATNITTTGFKANWGSSETALGYYVDVAADNTFTTFIGGYENRDVLDVLSYDITGLSPNTTYYYRVRAYNSGGVSSNSNDVNLTTLLEMPPVPAAPVSIPASDLTQTSFRANWSASSGAEGYYLDIAYDNAFTSYLTGYEVCNVGDVTTLNITGLTSGTNYYYRVRGYNISGTGDYSNLVSVTTLPDPPPAPAGLSASSCNNDIYLGWGASTHPDFMKYDIYWGTTPGSAANLTSVFNSSGNIFLFQDLENSTTYYFRIKTVITPGVESEFSQEVSAVVKTGVIPQIKSKWGDVLICYNQASLITSFRWYLGSSLISNATKQYYVTNKQPGLYHVETTDTDGCINSSNTIEIGGSKSLSVYPNPAKTSFTLNLSSEALGEIVVILYNSAGIKSLEYRSEKTDELLECMIPVDKLQDGIYTVEVIVNEEEINYTRLVKIE